MLTRVSPALLTPKGKKMKSKPADSPLLTQISLTEIFIESAGDITRRHGLRQEAAGNIYRVVDAEAASKSILTSGSALKDGLKKDHLMLCIGKDEEVTNFTLVRPTTTGYETVPDSAFSYVGGFKAIEKADRVALKTRVTIDLQTPGKS
jgi:hypothetical protein